MYNDVHAMCSSEVIPSQEDLLSELLGVRADEEVPHILLGLPLRLLAVLVGAVAAVPHLVARLQHLQNSKTGRINGASRVRHMQGRSTLSKSTPA